MLFVRWTAVIFLEEGMSYPSNIGYLSDIGARIRVEIARGGNRKEGGRGRDDDRRGFRGGDRFERRYRSSIENI